jgi:hypothetical protein
MPAAASAAYSRSVEALVTHLWGEDGFVLDLDDDIQRGVLITHDHRDLTAPPDAPRPDKDTHELRPVH